MYKLQSGSLEETLRTTKFLVWLVTTSALTLTAGAAVRLYLQPPPMPGVHYSIHAPKFSLDEVVHAMSRIYAIEPAFVKSVIAAESGFEQEALSPKGAIGLMQLMPETAAELGLDPADAEQNVEAGTRYLAWLMQRYRQKPNGVSWAIAAYNAGPGNVEKYAGIPPFKETQAYVTRVLGYYKTYRACDQNSNRLRSQEIEVPAPEAVMAD